MLGVEELLELEEDIMDNLKDNISGIVRLQLDEINRRLADRQLRIDITDAAIQYVIDNGYDADFGARPIKRFLQKHVETLAARMILAGLVKEGGTITIDANSDGLFAR